MNFKTISIITAIVVFVLGVGYLFFGSLMFGRWQIQSTNSVLLLGRRIGCLYIGLSVIYFLARSAPVSATRTALTAGTAVALLLLVIFGVFELTSGHVGNGILVSVVIEFLLALGYIRILVTDRKVKV